jgi:NitT/TauT family transport system ATP-binding protein
MADSAGNGTKHGPLLVADQPLLVADQVTLQYKTQNHLVTATWKVSFEVHQGDRYVLLGPSGCGKSSLLKSIAGFCRRCRARSSSMASRSSGRVPTA